MEETNENKKVIDFEFDWIGKDYDKIMPNVMAMAKKLLELNQIKVEKELDENGNIKILHTGVCRKNGLVESLSKGIVNEDIYSCVFRTNPKTSLNCLCKGRDESKVNYCQMSSCPILVAGYLYYLVYRDDSQKQMVEEFMPEATDTDIYARNYNELKKMELDKELEEFVAPLALPSIKTLRGNFIGEEGVDTETVISKISKYLYRIGKIETPQYTNVNFRDLVTKRINLDKNHLYIIQEIDDGVDYINKNLNNSKLPVQKQGNNSDNISIKEALKILKSGKKDRYIIINATPLELKKFFMLDPKLPYVFDQTIYFKDYTDEELLKLFEEELPEYHKNKIKDEFEKSFLIYLDRNRKYFPFKNKDLSIFLAGYIARKEELLLPKDQHDEKSLKDLCDNLIGMENIKEQLQQLNRLFALKKKLNKKGIEISNLNLHMMFLGNPGTGKTTVARMIAKILFDLGYIQENKVIETSRKDLVAEYIGQTAIKTTKTVEKAMGGVLFIDEAYSLKSCESDQYGDEAISTLIKLMEDYKNDLVVIFAGYSKEMQEFIHANSGIKSRIGYTFEFADYSTQELYKIFELKINAMNFTIDEEAKQYVMNLLEEGRKKKDFGNGRFVDNAIQKILIKHSNIENLDEENVTKFIKESIPTYDEVMSYSSGVREPEKIEELFNDIIGMNALKKQIIEMGNYIKFKKEVNKTDGKTLPDMNLHMMFLGNPGTGKTTIARKVTKMLYDLDCIKINKLVEVERKDLIGEYLGQTVPKTQTVIESALGGVLFIDEAYSLKSCESDQYGDEAISTLIKAMEDHKDELVVIFAGYTKEMQEFIHSNSGIKSRIGYTIEFADYSEDELYEILKLKTLKIGFEIDEGIMPNIMEILKFGKHKRDFGNGRFIDNLLTSMLKKHSTNYKKENLFIIEKEDIPTIEELMGETSGERNPDKIKELFESIVGMDKIKEQVIKLGKYIKFQNELSKISAKRLPDMRLHMLFNGDAGTGKTTMARKVTEMLYNLGVIRVNKLIEVNRKDLVGEYTGQTAPKTQTVIESALGGVLFIDEAYSLKSCQSDQYGDEAISTLIKAMEDNRDDLIVIFAGYTKEMKDFVNSNSGIASRIGYTFEFENYKDEQLYKIFEIKCKKYSLKINKNVKEKIMEVLKYFSSVENFGNGRFVDKLLQEILVKHSMNEKIEENLNKIMVEDIPTIKDMVEKTFSNDDNLVIPADIDNETRRKIAIHELGHAIIHYIYKGETNLKTITVIPEGTGALGYVLHTMPKTKVIYTKRDYLDEIEELLAGRAAEDMFLGKDNVSSGCWNDLEKVANKIDYMFNAYGMSETLGLVSAKNIKPSLEMQQKLDIEKKKTLDSCYENVKKVLQTNRSMFEKVLDTLMQKGTITGEEFSELVKNK